jgi:hypothetical protein
MRFFLDNTYYECLPYVDRIGNAKSFVSDAHPDYNTYATTLYVGRPIDNPSEKTYGAVIIRMNQELYEPLESENDNDLQKSEEYNTLAKRKNVPGFLKFYTLDTLLNPRIQTFDVFEQYYELRMYSDIEERRVAAEEKGEEFNNDLAIEMYRRENPYNEKNRDRIMFDINNTESMDYIRFYADGQVHPHPDLNGACKTLQDLVVEKKNATRVLKQLQDDYKEKVKEGKEDKDKVDTDLSEDLKSIETIIFGDGPFYSTQE